MARRVAELPMFSGRFLAGRWWNRFLDEIYPGSATVCVICHRVISPTSRWQKRGRSFTAEADRTADPAGVEASGNAFSLADANTLDRTESIDSLSQLEASEVLEPFICPFCLQEAAGIAEQQGNIRQLRVPRTTPPVSSTRDPRATFTLVPVYSAYRYEGFVQRTIRPWKYDGALGLTDWFVANLAALVDKYGLAQQFDFITPVPTSAARLKERGYHQTLALTRELGKLCRRPVLQALWRGQKETVAILGADDTAGRQTQTAKSARERQSALIGAFHWDESLDLRGARVLLVDDVVTTGATMQACAEQLFRARVDTVICLVIADVV